MSVTEVQLSTARQELPRLLSQVVRDGMPVRVKRRGGESAVLLDDAQLDRLLREIPFSAPERSVESDGSISYWLPVLELYANAPDELAAQTELAREVMDYAQDFLQQPALRHAPNRQHHLPLVLRAALSPGLEHVARALFA